MSDKYNIDLGKLIEHEGFKTEGYVPVITAKTIANNNPIANGKKVGDAIGKSGLTIGAGVDLGQMNKDDLRRLKLPIELANALTPFLGIRGNAALNLKLQLSSTEALLLTNRVTDAIVMQIVKRYEKDSGKQFNSLSPEVQWAVVDYFYQYGPYAMKNEPHLTLWKFMIINDWNKVVEFLLLQKNYKERRKSEAETIMKSIEFKPASFIPVLG
jgi:hypothetical protein